MCGIAGAVGFDRDSRPDPEKVRRMMAALEHRGPDGEGLWISPDGRAVLGHRRLSVIDLATGAQPMCGGDLRSAITFNGEIYNYRELRRELEARGVELRTKSDTEVLIRWYEIEGEACLARCNGMYAFAIWDGKNGRLLLSRDRLGKKPLYFARCEGVFYFASSLSSLHTVLHGTKNIDLAALDDFLSLGFIPAPRTIYHGIEKLESGTTVSLTDGVLVRKRYWVPAAPEREPLGNGSRGSDSLETLDALLSQAVSIRLRSDVPLGIFLSGGLDSTLVTAYAAREVSGIRTFTIGFGEECFDELAFAERVSRALGTEHRSFTVREGLLDLLPSLVRHSGEPFADASALPLWALAREARASITVALGGDGGDEAFAGYPWYGLHGRLEHRRVFVPGSVARAAAAMLAVLPSSSGGIRAAAGRAQRAFSVLAQPNPALRFGALRVHVSEADVRSWYGVLLREARREHLTAQHRIAAAYTDAPGDSLQRMRAADTAIHLADGLMPKSDLATMAHGLELRSPLLDHNVVSYGLSLHVNALEREGRGKQPLRALLSRQLARGLWERPKQGFIVPLVRWFRGGLRTRIESLPRSEVLRQAGWFSGDGLRRLVAEHVREERDHTSRLFNLVVLEEWLRQR